MSAFLRAAGLLILAGFAFASSAIAADQKQIEAAIQRGCQSLKARYSKGGAGGIAMGGEANHGIGPTCLTGLALLEGGTPVDDPALKTITSLIRNASYSQNKTYQTSLCLMYLDRLGDPADEPRIQMLAVRLLAGQSANGGWTYQTCADISGNDVQRLQALKPNPQAGKLHPEIKDYGQALFAAKTQSPIANITDDNSNTQFAILAVWMARKYGVPVESALDLIEKRFLATQNAQTGGWAYSGLSTGDSSSSPSMHCAGLIGLSTAVARREERRAKEEADKKDPPLKKGANPAAQQNVDDPFFNPPRPGGNDPKKAKAQPRHVDHRDRAVQLGFAGLGAILAESAKAGRGALVLASEGHGRHDLYFFWSLERVGVIYGVDKIGGVDWYAAGAHTLVHTQARDGSWSPAGVGGASFYSPELDTAFAVLFLTRSNLARDLAGRVQKEVSTEMRAGAGLAGTSAKPTDPGAALPKHSVVTDPVLPGVGGSEAAILAGELLRASEKDWTTVLKKLRDTKGSTYTRALVASVNRLDGDRQRQAREALAERLTRMTAETLRVMAKDEDVEYRRAAVLAMAMKDDKGHVRDLVAALLDDEEVVTRAAKAGLKSLTGQDFGPAVNATAGEKKLAVTAWNEWLGKQKK